MSEAKHKPHKFKNSGRVVFVVSKAHKTLRCHGEGEADANGDFGPSTLWRCYQRKGKKIRLESVLNGKSLRINAEKTDVKVSGAKGAKTWFEVQENGNTVKLKNRVTGAFIEVQENGAVVPGNDGSEFSFSCALGHGRHCKQFQPASKKHGWRYNFNCDEKVIHLFSYSGKSLRAVKESDSADGLGGYKNLTAWKVKIINKRKGLVKLKNAKTGKFLRLQKNEVNVGGKGGGQCKFKVHGAGTDLVQLESTKHPGKFVAVDGSGKVYVAEGGVDTLFNASKSTMQCKHKDKKNKKDKKDKKAKKEERKQKKAEGADSESESEDDSGEEELEEEVVEEVEPEEEAEEFNLEEESKDSFFQLIGEVEKNGKIYLSSKKKGHKLDLHSKDDASGRQRWIVDFKDGYSNILCVGGTPENRRWLSCNPEGAVDLDEKDDGSGKQRWIFEECKGDDDGKYSIRVAGGTNEGKTYLAASPDGEKVSLEDKPTPFEVLVAGERE